MFSPEQTKTMRPVLGRKYTADVLQVLASKDVTSRKEEPYGAAYIRTVFNGDSGNPVIEAAILEVYKMRKEAIDQLEQAKDELLKVETV
ncbi:hypothetical protein R1T16_05620 [Flavobacterium sp. DG1-102-2]|uniref:hypothetical protein n=1 Tax=Flavobacterium sp. DG1-102-2 TaxID=3081663 RepID=UPI00294A4695|nr:hypothetical protein [Flavobacterium sp. DG1-102-2]MDV6167894.1 hypothetical protein [Flavobacterium sp. DG1-102-2]